MLRWILAVCSMFFLFNTSFAHHEGTRFCSKGGTYYCERYARDPAGAEQCDDNVKDMLDPIYNPLWNLSEVCSNYEDATFEDWHETRELNLTGNDYIYKVHKRYDYIRGCRRSNGSLTPWQVPYYGVREYQCSPCKFPFKWDDEAGWTQSQGSCVTYCPPSKPNFNFETLSCEAEQPKQCPDTAGNPLIISTGEKIQIEMPDYSEQGLFPLQFQRNYKSTRSLHADPFFNQQFLVAGGGAMSPADREGWVKIWQPADYEGPTTGGWQTLTDEEGNESYIAPSIGDQQWKHNYQYRLFILEQGSRAQLNLPTGDSITFVTNGSGFRNLNFPGYDIKPIEIDGTQVGWEYKDKSKITQIYDMDGNLTRLKRTDAIYQDIYYSGLRVSQVVHSNGNTLDFVYDENLKLVAVNPNGGTHQSIKFEYDGVGNVTKISRDKLESGSVVESKSRIYHYENARHPWALTGITDENDDRYVTWEYDDRGRVTKNFYANNNESYEFEYIGEMVTKVTNPLGKVTTYSYNDNTGEKRLTNVAGEPSAHCGASNKSYIHLTSGAHKGKVQRQIDWNGNVTFFSYHSNGLIVRKREGYGTEDVVETSYEYHPSEPWVTKITTDTEITEYEYDANGNVIKTTVTPR